MLPTHYNTPVMEEEEAASRPCVECEVPRELLLHNDKLIPPLEIGFERFEEYKLDNETILEQISGEEEDYS